MDESRPLTVLTIGHSSHTWQQFLALVRGAGISALADVRSAPWSRRHPQFNRDAMTENLRAAGIAYVFLGDALGGRPRRPEFFCDGIADYDRMAAAPAFHAGLARVEEGARKFRLALLCAEQHPLDCHRCLLVGRALAGRGAGVDHVLPGGETVSQQQIENTLLALAGAGADDLFAPRDERIASAYRERARKVAFATPDRARGNAGG